MRPLEIVVAALVVAYALWPLLGPRPRLASIVPALAVALAVVHLFVEGPRWQMYGLYALTGIQFLASLPALVSRGREPASRATGWALVPRIAIVLLVGVATAIPALLPVPSSLSPTGPFAVGTRSYVLTDQNREEIYSGKAEARRFMMEIWYPALPPPRGTARARWLPDAKLIAPAIAGFYNLPRFFFDHLALAETDTYENIPVDAGDGPYPVLIFSHGWYGFRQQSTFLMQELASHGYVVVATEHPYGSVMTVFPDGTIAPVNPTALPEGKPDDEYELAARILVNQWAGDISYALDTLQEWNALDPAGNFTGVMQMDRVGVFGHSTGGGATIEFCGTDDRCTAGLTLDAFMRPVSLDVLNRGTTQPFFYMFSELWPFERNTELFDRYYGQVDPANEAVTILGASHFDFTDMPALSPLAARLNLKGPINGKRVQQIINRYTVAYFDRELKGIPSALFSGPQSEFPEVRYDRP